MKTRRERSWQMLLLALFAWLMPQQMQADDMTDKKYFTLEKKSNYVHFEVLLTDLYANNTWAKDGVIKAYSGNNRNGSSYELVRVYTKEMDDDDEEYYNVWVTNKRNTAKVWLDKTRSGSREIGTSEVEESIYKGKSSNRTYAKLDYYYGPELVGKTWYFYYEYTHNSDKTHNMYIGSAELSSTMGLKNIDLTKYKCERTGPKSFSFTTPAMPNDVSESLKTIRQHFGQYVVTMTYHLYDGKTATKKDTVECTFGKSGDIYGQAYVIEIPDEVGNYKTVDMKVEATDRLDGYNDDGKEGNYYWKNTATYEEKDMALTVPIASNITTSYLQFDNKIELTWNTHPNDLKAGKYYTNSEPYIYRIETEKDGTVMSGQSWSRRTRLDSISTKSSLSYIDRDAKVNKYYRYMIVNVPKAWVEKKFISEADMKEPTDALLKQLGYGLSDVIETKPSVSIYDLSQDNTVTDKVKLTWQYSRVPVSQQSVEFNIWRRKVGTTQWAKYGEPVLADAQPTSGTVTAFFDESLPNNTTSFEYKVVLSINNDFNTFESNEVTAGLLGHTTITEMKATQGTYDGGVLVSWKVKQIGTDETVYRLYRYLVGKPDKKDKITDTSGTRDSYTFEDKNAEPGYYYEYLLEAHSKSNDSSVNTYQDGGKAVGFSKTGGTVTGRITFGTGTSVEGARVSLRPSDSKGAIQSYSQRVDGASTGIQWKAIEEELAKVFGPDKNFTVQMFVRPDSALSEGAVLGEIPGEGRLAFGNQTSGDYELTLQKVSGYVEPVVVPPVWIDPVLPVSNKTTNLSTLTSNYEAQHGETLTGTLNGNYKISIAAGATVYLKDVTINGVNEYSYKWAGITCPGDATIILEGRNTVKGFYNQYPGIHIAKNKTLTIKGTGSLTVTSNGNGAGIGGGYNISCGNIIIEGGTITASCSEDDGAGIGAGRYDYCGNITITGGVIKATGGTYASGIGGGYNSYCGAITITNTVTSVTATKGSKGKFCIGRGYNRDDSTCGVITIGGVVYWNGKDVTNQWEFLSNTTHTHPGDGSWAINYQHEKDGYEKEKEYTIPGYCTYGTATNTGVKLSSNTYSQLTITRTGDNLQFQVDDGEAKTLTATKYKYLAPFSVGGADNVKTAQAFKGNFTEVRVWNKALSDAEKANCYDRMLNGREDNLALYWPMDAGLDHFVFDASYASGQPNGRHATVGVSVSTSPIVPAEDQLSRYALTNENGEYQIHGIPFVSEGTSYTLTPTLGIHEFNPKTRSGYISKKNSQLDNYDFNDISSFPMRGQVTYLGTNIPVDSVQFMIDGSLLQSKEGIYSDANGNYQIDVPIGEHLIECMKNGHRLTSFPLDKTKKYDFRRAETVNFVDSTLVNVTGRVNGGFSDAEEPVGFGKSKNRIGKAEIKLSLGKESQCSFNYVVNDRGEGNFGTKDIDVESASPTAIASKAYRSGTTHDEITDNENTHYIYITTDSVTGEFSAMLPPLKYVVESIRLVGGKDYNDEPVFTQNLPVIDATNTKKELMKYDSLTVDGVLKKYTYSAKMIRQYRAEPEIKVKQLNLPEGLFGERKVAYVDDKFETDSIVVLNETAEKKYTFGHPVFVQGKHYGYGIDVAESYTNQDTKKTIKEFPRDAWINISNEASATTTIYGNKGTIGRDSIEVGMPYETMQIEIQPNEYGHAEYEFVAGAPNMAEGHLLGMSVSVEVDKRTTMWKAPNSATNALDLVVLGSINSGTNYVTQGPDHVDMILRRPPGSTSVAKLTNKEVTVYSHTKVNTSGDTFTGGAYISETPTFEASGGNTIGMITILKDSKYKVVSNQRITDTNKYSDSNVSENDTTYTVTQEMMTPTSMQIISETKSYIPEAGDTYIGRSTNMLFGRGRILGIFKNDKNEYGIGEREGITVGEQFRTYFVFPQAHILNTLIPDWQSIIESRLVEGHIDADHTKKENCPEIAGKVMYYTKYKPGDREFGKANGDLSFWTKDQIKAADGHPSYTIVDGTHNKDLQDEVENAINQIKRWQAVIAFNEEDKLDAFGDEKNKIDNFSIASGSSVSRTDETTYTAGKTEKTDNTTYVTIDDNLGFMYNEAGAYAIISSTWEQGVQTSDGKTTSKSNSVSWTMSDADPRTSLSVDVYKSPKGWGPIFRTRGGQTANPYEDGSVTKFYDPGTKLNEATMRVEKPELHVKGATEITDVPTGGQALFTLQLSNQSESNSICNYVLQVVDKTNPSGAVLTIDGNILSNGKDGRLIKFNPKEEMLKTLVVTQSNEAVTDYEDIELVLRSEKDATIKSDPVKLRVHFVPASSPVELAVDHTVLNEKDKILYGGVMATMSGLDRSGDRLKGVRLRYRRKGTDAWTQLAMWSNEATYQQQGAKKLEDGSTIKEDVVFTDDGLYELQAQTWGLYGGKEVTYQSNIVEIRQDTHGPKLLGMVSPENGLLTWLNRNNMHIRFNEQLNVNAISQSDNIIIEGGLNDVVAEEGRPYPDVALQLNGDRIETEAVYDLSDTSFALDMWLYRQGDGKIVSLGSTGNLLSLSTHDGGLVSASLGDEDNVVDAIARLPENKWTYMAMNYKPKDGDKSMGELTLLYTTADDPKANYVFRNEEIEAVDCHGKLSVGGSGMQGMMARMSVWNSNITAEKLYEDRNKQRAAYTPGLIGYWKMDEGHGTQVTDIARSRHMQMPTESWYINNENRAAHLDGKEGSALKIDVSTFQPASTDDFAYEMWFRGNKADNNKADATLMSVDNSDKGKTAIGFGQGKLMLKVTDSDFTLSEKDYLDGNWHHLALNVRRGISAIAYMDGEAIKVLPEASVPGIMSQYLVVGGELNDDTESNRFTGDVDEIRIWKASIDGQLIKERMYERVDNGYPGLEGYFPMEDIHRTQQGNPVTEFSLDNFGDASSYVTMVKDSVIVDGVKVARITQALNAPALKPSSSKMRLLGSQYDFTVSADELYLSFPDGTLPLMDGNDFVVTVSNIKDEHGNKSLPVSWKFHTNFASVDWGSSTGDYERDFIKRWDQEMDIDISIFNSTGTPQSFEISGIPSWMTVDRTIGTINGDWGYVTFRLGTDVPIGRHTEYIYVTDHLGIRRVLKFNLTVTGDVPDWTVDPDLYESNMTLTGQILINDKICDNTDTKIAAFDDLGLCRGVASPKYVRTRDAYYVDMVIYGASATELSSGTSELLFKVYDASTGTIHPMVGVVIPGKDYALSMQYALDANYGSYDAPVVLDVANALEQNISLAKGWTWMSIYVEPLIESLEWQLPRDKNILKRFKNIKSQTDGFANVDKNGVIGGNLEKMDPGKMYKMQLSTKTDFDLIGLALNTKILSQTMHPGYNWIGTLSSSVMSVDEAFAELQPEPGDRVKSRTAFAEFSSKGYWEGTLESIVPGQGYIYRSKAAKEKTFHYPSGTAAKANARAAARSTLSHFTPADPYLYPDNLNIIAVVKKDGLELDNAEIGAFIDSECRGAISYNKGYYFLTVMGTSEDDSQKKLQLRVYVDGDEYVVDNSLSFISDAAYGTLDEPLVFDLQESQKVKLGDANGDGTVNMDDVAVTRDYIMDNRPKTFNFFAADVNGDKVIDAADVVEIINIIMSQASATRQ